MIKQNFKKNRLISSKKSLIVSAFVFAVFGAGVYGLYTDSNNSIGTSLASSQEPADINSDNKVDIVDLSILLSNWGTNNNLSDINSDNTVDIVDLSILLSRWGSVTTGGLIFNVKDYGAIGNNINDDTSAIQSTIAAAEAGGGTVLIPDGTYRITNNLNVPANSTISGTGELHQVTSAKYGLYITGNNVTVDGITLTGRHSDTAYWGSEYAIYSYGTSSNPRRNININNVTISKWGAYGVRLEHVIDFEITNGDYFDIGYTGIGVLSASQGLIENNTIDNITPGSSGDMYGIAMTQSGLEPASTDIVVRGNTVSRVEWEAIDTHGGSRLTIDNNTILSSGIGVAIVNGSSPNHVSQDLIITNNYIDGERDQTLPKDTAILLQGFEDGSGNIIPVTGVISGNTMRRVNIGAYFWTTEGLEISDNSFEDCHGWGIFAYYDNKDFQITNNNFIDMWSNYSWTSAIYTGASGGTNTGLISGNTLIRGPRQATYINQYGYYYRGGMAGVTVTNNDFAAATVAPIAGEN